jgi:hypothetical protein
MNQYYKRKEANKLDDREKWRVINTDEDYILCSKCLKTNKATKSDISTKNPSYYLKNCKNCRDYYNNYKIAKGIDYKKYQRL